MSAYQVMIGVPDAEQETALTQRFEELPDAEVVSAHRTSHEISEMVGQLPTLDVVLIHEGLGPLPVFDLIRDISRNYPQLAVILLSDEVQPDTYTDAMEAGARGVLSTDATIEQFAARIATAGDWSRTLRQHLEAASHDVPTTGRRGSIMTFSGSKGGVGTTTTVIHLARMAAKYGRLVCLVDLDLQKGDMPGYFDLKHRRSIADLVDAAEDISASMLADTLYVHPDGPHILLAPDEGEKGEDVSARATRMILGALRSRYDLVLVDCGSAMNEATAMAVEICDTAVLLTNPDLPALRGAQRVISSWDRLQIRDKDSVRGLLMRHSRKNEIQPEFARKLVGNDFFKTPIPANYRALEEASNTGDPSKLNDEGLLKAYSQLAKEAGLFTTPEDEEQASKEVDAAKEPKSGKFGAVKHSGKKRLLSKKEKADAGAGFVEFALVVPLICFGALLAWQVLLIGLTGMYASHAANEGARQAVLTPNNDDRITEEATKRIRAPWNADDVFHLDVVRTATNTPRTVNVTIDMPAVLPGSSSPWDVSGSARVPNER
ncbi:AAA family ATPase [Nocardiopsis suaedae]|uniref:AAA family ATPase n=1 Tax=Nocardiopsis suaedae TaxID=3018444 RepID=A0ABT4TRF9_9ACTN|nr:AAA family ATPase [Nocardiopsis suaedae]MDA2807265.1 AAA family ATPase [Nocardiopsis suaedae]